jgi:hypothetical protein
MMVRRMKDKELREASKTRGASRHNMMQKANMAYLRKHYKQLLKDHPNEWVLVRGGGKNVTVEKEPEEFEATLAKTRAADGFSFFLADPEDVMLL